MWRRSVGLSHVMFWCSTGPRKTLVDCFYCVDLVPWDLFKHFSGLLLNDLFGTIFYFLGVSRSALANPR